MKRFELMPNEAVLIDAPIHWKNYLSSFLALALSLFLLLVRIHLWDTSLLNLILKKPYIPHGMNTVIEYVETAVLALSIVSAFLRMVEISYIRYYVTNKRIVAISGVINRQFQEMVLSKCEMVYLNQNAYERMYNSGDILCVSAGASLFLDDVRDAVAFKQFLMILLSSQNQAKNENQ